MEKSVYNGIDPYSSIVSIFCLSGGKLAVRFKKIYIKIPKRILAYLVSLSAYWPCSLDLILVKHSVFVISRQKREKLARKSKILR